LRKSARVAVVDLRSRLVSRGQTWRSSLRRIVPCLAALAWRAAQALVALTGLGVGEAVAQSNIPLQLIGLKDGSQRLQINVGINGGASQPYLFDTGSALFNAAYNPAWWGGVPSSSSLARDVQYRYGNGVGGCRGFIGNLRPVGKDNSGALPVDQRAARR
jgi:hypothetical protein